MIEHRFDIHNHLELDSRQTRVILFFDDVSLSVMKDTVSSEDADRVAEYQSSNRFKTDKIVSIQRSLAHDAAQLVLVNLGESKAITVSKFRSLVGDATRKLVSQSEVQWAMMGEMDQWAWHVAQVITMVENDHGYFKTTHDAIEYPRHTIITDHSADIAQGQVIGHAVNTARYLSELPGNKLSPDDFVATIQAMFEDDDRYQVIVFNEDDLLDQNMGALLSVGQGSVSDTYLVDITYTPASSTTDDHVALVGKGITFDTGGVSLKPSSRMKDMKGDMGGAAAVVATAWAAGQLDVDRRVSFIVPIAENMVSMMAQRPGDVVTASNGVTIEVTNTDAEGRLILADALVYAVSKGVTRIVDVATLTGASTIALGPYATAVLGNHSEMIHALIESGAAVNETLWQLPLFDAYDELLKSDVADTLNANEGREAGTITAAKFLEKFVDGTPWAHLDIASTMMAKRASGEQSKGMTGAGTRTLIQFLLSDYSIQS